MLIYLAGTKAHQKRNSDALKARTKQRADHTIHLIDETFPDEQTV
jgi:hypothetical protein